MSKRIGPEAKIIQLFTALPEASKVIVFDVIKSQQPKKAKSKKKEEKPKAIAAGAGDGSTTQ